MKQRSTTPVSKGLTTKSILVAAAVLMAVATPIQMGSIANARDFEAEINAKLNLVDQYQARAGELRQKANTLKNELARLSAEKATIQAQLDLSQAKHDQLIIDIKANEQKIADNKDALGTTIADMYVDNSISPLEMLASSNNIGDYVDKQSYRASVSDQLQETIDTIKKLKAELEEQKADVTRVIADQKNQRQSLVAKENERQNILDKTKGEEAAYQQMSAEKNAEVEQLRAEQAAAIAARAQQAGGGSFVALPGDPNSGGYPAVWRNAPMNAYVDDWGMYSRQCVSYAAWKVDSTYGNMPFWGGIGNANQWDENARAAGIKVNGVPAAGTVGVQNTAPYGHVGWIEAVHGDGTMTISQFNAGWTGEYSVWRVPTSFFDQYIYFGG
ncbi:MAG TPA: CHAP domain-containing protein [Candidatus Saccharimonadales bacterium]|nr:CHAP domain-containing protein [Candidatus Saccharimonadales bacterium]